MSQTGKVVLGVIALLILLPILIGLVKFILGLGLTLVKLAIGLVVLLAIILFIAGLIRRSVRV